MRDKLGEISTPRRTALDIVHRHYYSLPNNGTLNSGLNSCKSRYIESITCGLTSVDLLLEHLRDVLGISPSGLEFLEEVKLEMLRMQSEGGRATLDELC